MNARARDAALEPSVFFQPIHNQLVSSIEQVLCIGYECMGRRARARKPIRVSVCKWVRVRRCVRVRVSLVWIRSKQRLCSTEWRERMRKSALFTAAAHTGGCSLIHFSLRTETNTYPLYSCSWTTTTRIEFKMILSFKLTPHSSNGIAFSQIDRSNNWRTCGSKFLEAAPWSMVIIIGSSHVGFIHGKKNNLRRFPQQIEYPVRISSRLSLLVGGKM